MPELNRAGPDWDAAKCPNCGGNVRIGIMSLCATCECGAFLTAHPKRWYASKAGYYAGDAPLEGKPCLS